MVGPALGYRGQITAFAIDRARTTFATPALPGGVTSILKRLNGFYFLAWSILFAGVSNPPCMAKVLQV